MAVATEPKTGIMTEEKGQAKVSPETEVETPEQSEVSPEEQEPKIYTQKQADALVHAAKSEGGRKVKAAEIERDSYKSKLEVKESELADNATEIESLQAKFDDMAKEDPAKFDVAKELKSLREERKKLKADQTALATERQTYGEEVRVAKDTMREIRVWEIAAEYEGGDPVVLKNLCDTFEANTEEQIRKAADTIWTKPAEKETKLKAPKPYSGKSEGGTPYFTRAQIADRSFWNEHKDEILKAQKEGRIKD